MILRSCKIHLLSQSPTAPAVGVHEVAAVAGQGGGEGEHDGAERGELVIKFPGLRHVAGLHQDTCHVSRVTRIMTVGSHLECQLQTAQTHSETHGVEVDVIILGGRGATAVISIGCKVFSEWTQGVHIFEYRNIHRDFLTSSLPNIFRHVLLGPGEQVQQRGRA